jgi:hypothetical protein
MDDWRRRKGITAFFREKHMGKIRNSSQVFEQEEFRWTGATVQESWEEQRIERIWHWFALGNRPGSYRGRLRSNGDGEGSEWEEQRSERLSRRENKRSMDGKEIRKTSRISQSDEVCRNLFCELGNGDQTMGLFVRVGATNCDLSETFGFEVIKESFIIK